MSISVAHQAWGEVCRLRTMCSAIARRIGLSGISWSPSPARGGADALGWSSGLGARGGCGPGGDAAPAIDLGFDAAIPGTATAGAARVAPGACAAPWFP